MEHACLIKKKISPQTEMSVMKCLLKSRQWIGKCLCCFTVDRVIPDETTDKHEEPSTLNVTVTEQDSVDAAANVDAVVNVDTVANVDAAANVDVAANVDAVVNVDAVANVDAAANVDAVADVDAVVHLVHESKQNSTVDFDSAGKFCDDMDEFVLL